MSQQTTIPQAAAVVLVVATILFFLGLRKGGPWARMAALVWGAILLPRTSAPRHPEIVALDVGHGTAVVLRAPDASCWVFDAGSRDRPRVARTALAPLLAAWEVSEPAVVLSHGDGDHASALPWLVERYPPRLGPPVSCPSPLGRHPCFPSPLAPNPTPIHGIPHGQPLFTDGLGPPGVRRSQNRPAVGADPAAQVRAGLPPDSAAHQAGIPKQGALSGLVVPCHRVPLCGNVLL